MAKFEIKSFGSLPKEYKSVRHTAGAVQQSAIIVSSLQSKSKSRGKGRAIPAKFFAQALQSAVSAFASGYTGNKGLLTAQAQSLAGVEPVQAAGFWYLSCKQLLLPVCCFAERVQGQQRQLSCFPTNPGQQKFLMCMPFADYTPLNLATRLHLPSWLKTVLQSEHCS